MKKVHFITLTWLLFSVFYFISAYFKPFHIDEFFSWVYADRCSFTEILRLKETGIGHLPPFHLLQKTVQTISPIHSPIEVRLVNYVLGSIFVILLINFLSKYKQNWFFLISASLSGAVLNIFVFARMWAMVTLFGLLVLIFGERYVNDTNWKNLIFFVLAIIGGFLADYNFILIMPYVLLVFLNPLKKRNILIWVGSISALMITFVLIKNFNNGIHSLDMLLYLYMYDLLKLGSEFYVLIFNSWYVEFLIISSIALFSISIYNLFFRGNTKKNQLGNLCLVGLSCLSIFYLPAKYDLLRMIYILVLLLVSSFVIVFFIKKKDLFKYIKYDRIIFGILGAFLILISISPVFWRPLVYARFMGVLSPLIFFMLYKNFSNISLNIISTLLIISGILYISSARVDDYYPAKATFTNDQVVFQNASAYASQYIRNDRLENIVPYILDKDMYKVNCKLCDIGSSEVPFNSFKKYIYIGDKMIPESLNRTDFKINKVEDWCLFPMDKLLFRVFTPLRQEHFYKYTMERNF